LLDGLRQVARDVVGRGALGGEGDRERRAEVLRPHVELDILDADARVLELEEGLIVEAHQGGEVAAMDALVEGGRIGSGIAGQGDAAPTCRDTQDHILIPDLIPIP
jgi:hypothetical protein